eukprot:7957102-Ditylum_brightwellii.AAC.1
MTLALFLEYDNATLNVMGELFEFKVVKLPHPYQSEMYAPDLPSTIYVSHFVDKFGEANIIQISH